MINVKDLINTLIKLPEDANIYLEIESGLGVIIADLDGDEDHDLKGFIDIGNTARQNQKSNNQLREVVEAAKLFSMKVSTPYGGDGYILELEADGIEDPHKIEISKETFERFSGVALLALARKEMERLEAKNIVRRALVEAEQEQQ